MEHRFAPKSASAVLAETEAQWIFTPTELSNTPSIADGMAVPAEHEMRTKGLNFILQVGIMLKIQQMTLYTAGVFFNRFLMRHSLRKTAANTKPLHHYQAAAISLLLATKTDETIRRQKDIIIACCRVAQKNPTLQIDEQNKDYWKWRDTLLYNEDVLLEALCFDLTVMSPYKLLYEMLQRLHLHSHKVIRNAAWAFLCDGLMTTLCLLQTSQTIAGAALYCGARHAGLVLAGEGGGQEEADEKGDHTNGTTTPKTPMVHVQVSGEAVEAIPPWWDVVGVRMHDVKKACNYMSEIYVRRTGEGETPNTNGDGKTPVDTNGRTPDASGTSQSHGQIQAQPNGYKSSNPDIYNNLRSEVSDEEEDGELVDDDEDEEGEASRPAAKETNGSAAESQEKRGVKRAREGDDGDAG